MRLLLPIIPTPRPKQQRRRRNRERKRAVAMGLQELAPPPRIVRRQHAGRDLPDDLLLDILVRVPYRSLCRFKAVSPPWLALCSAAALRRNKPPNYQTLSGFFFLDRTSRVTKNPLDCRYRYNFVNVDGRRPTVDASRWSYLPGYYNVSFVDCCNGLLLLRCWPHTLMAIHYVVCNPANRNRKRHIVLPPLLGKTASPSDQMCLGFDSAVSPNQFRVFFLHCSSLDAVCYGLSVYSSEAKRWIFTSFSKSCRAAPRPQTAFFNGSLHLTTQENLVLAMDEEGETYTWRSIRTPCRFSFLGHSEGHLYAVQQQDRGKESRISIWSLEDYSGQHWTMKHTVDAAKLFAESGGSDINNAGSYTVVAFHPDRDMVFLCAAVFHSQHLMSYDMDSGKLQYICTVGAELSNAFVSPYVPYIPCLYQSA